MNTGYLLMNVSKQLRYELNLSLASIGITVQQWAVIQQVGQLSSNNNSATAVKLTKNLDMDKPTISGIINRLIKKGIILRQANPSDSRSYLLLLTKDGRGYLEKGEEISNRLLTDYLSKLSLVEQDQLNKILTKLNKADTISSEKGVQ
ncbi:MarR family winged helix-turn-helix transcriptional regulator [Enterococcus sp. LJL128]|uniref:MarR family winged helix-turn-helix transcriptional regulator n=1 Tax=Enterococcus sp. LJL51 TaxID=3416656 RepID=UPI003CEC7675